MLKAVVNSPVRSGNQTINNGDLIIGTSGNGIDFSANNHAAGMTGEKLTWYEEGTWTPSLGGDATYTANTKGWYTRIGRFVVVQADLEVNVLGTGSTQAVSGLPFLVNASAPAASGTCSYFYGLAINVYSLIPYAPDGSAVFWRAQTDFDNTISTNVAIFASGARVQFTFMYFT